MFKHIIHGDSIAYRIEFDNTFNISDISFLSMFKIDKDDAIPLLTKQFTAPININSKNGILYVYYNESEMLMLPHGNIWFQFKMIIPTNKARKVITLYNQKIKIISDITQKEGADINAT